jgi:hypothetical protein
MLYKVFGEILVRRKKRIKIIEIFEMILKRRIILRNEIIY